MIPAAAALIVIAIGAATSTQLDLGPLIQFVLGGGLVAVIASIIVWRKFPHEADKLDAQRDEIMQDLGRKNTEAAAHVVDLVKDEIEALKVERSSLRDRALAAEALAARAKAEQAQTHAELAQTIAELATEKAARSEERHDMRSELTARDAEIAKLRSEVAELRGQLAELLASHGLVGRRAGDRPD